MALTRPRYSQIYDTDYKQSVRLATTTDVGNLLAVSSITNSVDGVTVAVNDRILVKNQSDAKQNGIYRVVTVGTGSNGTWVRALDADQNGEGKVTSGLTTTVTEGTDNNGKTFKLSTVDPIIVGTTSLTFINPFEITATAAGANTYVQFNDTGSLMGGSAGFTFNKTSNLLTVTGNITSTSGYFLGNGSQLTGIDATAIQNGTSNIRAFSSGNVTVSVAGTANAAVFTTSNIIVSGVSTTGLIVSTKSGSAIRAENGSIYAGQNGTFVNAVLTNSLNPYTGSNIGLSSIYNFSDVKNIWASNIYITNELSIGSNVTVGGNLTVNGNLVYLDVDNIVTQDALIYVADGNQYDFLDIGIVGKYTKNGFNQHGGIVRDTDDAIWKFFANVESAPTTVVDFGSATYDGILAGNIMAIGNVVVGANITLNRRLYAGGSSGDAGQYLSSTGTGVGWSTFDFSTLSNGTDVISASGTGFVNVEISGNLITSYSDQGIQFGSPPYVQNQYILWGTTTDATETEVFINGDGSSRIPVNTDTTMMYEINISARRTDATGVSGSWHLKGCADNFAGNVQDVGDVYEIIVGTDYGNLAVDARADNTHNSLNVYVTGVANQTFRWVAILKTIEVSE